MATIKQRKICTVCGKKVVIDKMTNNYCSVHVGTELVQSVQSVQNLKTEFFQVSAQEHVSETRKFLDKMKLRPTYFSRHLFSQDEQGSEDWYQSNIPHFNFQISQI